MPKDFYESVTLPVGFDKEIVKEAYLFAKKAHAGQKRKSGDLYITHPVAVGKILLHLGMGDEMIAAAMLHDVVEDTKITEMDIEEKFGKNISGLVIAVTNLGKVDFDAYSTSEEAEEAVLHAKNENLRQLFMAMAEDVRVVVIKLADRLHNMQTIKALPKKDQIRIAKETLNIFAPLALRLGMGEIKGELEDLAFPIAYPAEYALLKKEANRRYKAADRYTLHVKRVISDKLREGGIKAMTDGRAKHIYSLYKKISRPEIDWDFDKIYDLVALRILTNTIEECYKALGIIHTMYRPLPNYIRDYISAPKPNGYRSIHTSVFGPEAKIMEIQIRTKKMHEEAEYGVASHLHYTEQKNTGVSDEKLTKGTFGEKSQTEFLKTIKEWQKGNLNDEEFVEGLKIEFLDDRIYVFSPLGDIYDLPVGATPIDFAYEVHSSIGNGCRGAKVNGKIVPLEHKLATRDVVEILTKRDAGPKRDWLDFVKTSKARQHIRAYFRQFDYERNKEDGKNIITEELALLGINLDKITGAKLKDAIAETSFKTAADLYASCGSGLTTPRQAVKIILRKTFIPETKEKAKQVHGKAPKEISRNMKASIAPCCNPKPTDHIICYITRGKGLTAHKSTCPNLKTLEAERLFTHNPWAREKLKIKVRIEGKNRMGLIRDISSVISERGINIETFIDSKKKKEKSILEISVSVDDYTEAADLIKRLKKVEDVEGVKRI